MTEPTQNSPDPWVDHAADLILDLLVTRKRWEESVDDRALNHAYLQAHGEVYARLVRDIETHGNDALEAKRQQDIEDAL